MDILLDEDDLDFASGDLAVGDDLVQRQQLIVGSSKNEFKQWPEMGVGTEGFLDEDDATALFAEIREQFKLDKLVVKSIAIDNEGKILIDGAES